MVLAKVKPFTFKMHAAVFVMIMVPMQIKYGWIGTGFIWLNIMILTLEQVVQVDISENLTRWVCTQSKGFTKKDIEKVSRSVGTYTYI